MMNLRGKLIAANLLLLIVVLVTTYVIYRQYQDKKYRDFVAEQQKVLLSGQSKASQGDLLGAIGSYGDFINSGIKGGLVDFVLVSQISTKLATKDSQLTMDGMQQTSDMLVDPKTNGVTKAWLINTLISHYATTKSADFLRSITDYEPFVSQRGLDLEKVYEYLLKTSNDHAPTSMGRVRLADHLAGKIITDRSRLPVYQESVQSLVTQSELLFESENGNYDTGVFKLLKALIITLQGLALGALDDDLNIKIAEKKFQEALNLADNDPDNLLLQQVSLYTHLYYANLLARYRLPEERSKFDKQIGILVTKMREPYAQDFSVYIKENADMDTVYPYHKIFIDRLIYNSDQFAAAVQKN